MPSLLAARRVLAPDARAPLIDRMPPDDDDAGLAARIRLGDAAAFEAVFLRYVVPLCAFAFRYVRSRDLAAELVQDVFLRIWQQRERWEIQGSLQAYLYRATRNRALDFLKHADVERRWAEQSAGAGDRDIAVSPPADDAEDIAALTTALERALDMLPERRREVFLLRWRDGLSYAQIADLMGTSVKTVANQMNHAIRTLREAVAS